MFHAFRRSLTAFALVLVAALASSARASIEHPDPRAEALYESAMKRLERPTIEGRREAIVELEQATLYDKHQPEYELALARLYAQCGYLTHARQRYERVAHLAPTDGRARLGLGQMWRRDWLKYLEPASLDRAVLHLSAAGRLDPHLEDAWIQLTPLLIELGEVAGAEAAAERAIEADPNLPDAQLALAYTSFRLGRVQRADSLFHLVVPRFSRIVRDQFETIAPIVTEADTAYLNHLPDPEQKAFVARFWSDNDPDLASPENEALLEYWSRVAHAYFLYFNAKRREWDLRGEVYVRYGPPKYTAYNPVGSTLRVTHGVTLDYPANALRWDYPDLGMRVWLQDRSLTEYYLLPIAIKDSMDPHPFPDSLESKQGEALAIRGGRGVFPKLPPGVARLPISGAVARFQTDDGPRLLAQVEAPGEPGDSLWAEWVVLDSTRHEVGRGTRALSPSACDATRRRVADFATALPPGHYLIGLTVRDGDRRRGVFRAEADIVDARQGLSLSDVVVACGLPNVFTGPGVRIEPNPEARVTGADPLNAYFEIYHLAPGRDGHSRFEYQYTVKSVEKDPRIWIKRVLSPRPRVPEISASREEENPGSVRRQFVSVPVESLPVGKYRLEITVRDLVAGNAATRSAGFIKVAESLTN